MYQISDIFEVKGIKIAKVDLNIAENNSFCPRKQCCPLALYSLCYSVIKPCSYWDSNTLAAIVNIGTKFYHCCVLFTLWPCIVECSINKYLSQSLKKTTEKSNIWSYIDLGKLTRRAPGLFILTSHSVPNTLSVNCKLTRLRCVLLSFLIGKFAKTGSLFNSQFTVQFLTHMSLPYLETKGHAINVT